MVTMNLAKKSARHLPVWSAIFAAGIICDVLNCGGPATPASPWPSSMRCSDVRLTRQSEHTASRPTASSSLTSSTIIAVGDNLHHHRRGALTSDRTLPGVWHVSWSTPRHIPRHHHRWRRSSSPDQRLHHHRRGHLRRGALTSNRTLPGVWLVSWSTPRQGARHHRHLLSSQTSSTVIADVIGCRRWLHLLSSLTSFAVVADFICCRRWCHLSSSPSETAFTIIDAVLWRQTVPSRVSDSVGAHRVTSHGAIIADVIFFQLNGALRTTSLSRVSQLHSDVVILLDSCVTTDCGATLWRHNPFRGKFQGKFHGQVPKWWWIYKLDDELIIWIMNWWHLITSIMNWWLG